MFVFGVRALDRMGDLRRRIRGRIVQFELRLCGEIGCEKKEQEDKAFHDDKIFGFTMGSINYFAGQMFTLLAPRGCENTDAIYFPLLVVWCVIH